MFSTTKKKLEPTEKYAAPVMTYLPSDKDGVRSNYVFSLNKAAMEAFGFPMNTPNTSKVANGYDEMNNLVLAAIDTQDTYTSVVTAKNTFSSKKLFSRLAAQHDEVNENTVSEFGLIFTEGSKEALIALIVPDVEEDFVETPPSIEELVEGTKEVSETDFQEAVVSPSVADF